MAYRLNFADNRLPIFHQSRLPITNILSVLSFTDADILSVQTFTDTDNRYFKKCRYIGKPICHPWFVPSWVFEIGKCNFLQCCAICRSVSRCPSVLRNVKVGCVQCPGVLARFQILQPSVIVMLTIVSDIWTRMRTTTRPLSLYKP